MSGVRTVFPLLTRLRPARHGVVLGTVALSFLAAGHRHVYVAVPNSFLMYGAVHASTLWVSLREPPPSRQMLVFVAAAALMSLTGAVLGMRAMYLLAAFAVRGGPRIALGLAALTGALAYAAMIRVLWMPGLSLHSMCFVALSCVLATLAASLLGASAMGGGGAVIAVAWWCAMSAGLCCCESVRR